MPISETISVELDDGREIKLPTKFVVCHTCEGRGKHSQHLGAITQEDRDLDWDAEDWDNYMAGGYDRTCETCNGDRVVAVVDRDQIERSSNAELKEALIEYDEGIEIDREIDAMHAAELRMGC